MPRENVEAPMPGRITTIMVKVGDTVKTDDTILEMESMKMQNPIVAPRGGKIAEIRVSPNQAVDTGAVLAVIEY